MKSLRAVACLGLAAVAGSTSVDISAGAGLSPVSRIVELLGMLSKQVETEAKAEEDLFETFVCWAKSMISQKTKSNAVAEGRSGELRTYIADLDAGRIELTSERSDLTKEIEELSSDIEVATQMRDKENKDFEGAKEEMQQAIDALTKAVEVLRTATEDHKKGVLLAFHSRMGVGFEERKHEAEALQRAVALGSRVLTHSDGSFLQRLLTGEVPKADWKKLNRKATFKMDYKARSFKIQDVLAKLLETFASDLQAAEKKEADSLALYNKLMDAKGNEKGTAQDALSRMDTENGARGLSREESQSELDSLTSQVESDNKYIGQVQQALDAKKQEWKDRKELRAGELAAISKAVQILHNDDARDMFKRSFASQDKSKAAAAFVQLSSATSAAARRGARAVEVLRAAGAGRDVRMAVLATKAEAASGGHFDEVIAAVDRMLEALQREENSDLAKKEQCEKHRAADTREAILLSRAMDELTDQIRADRNTIAELTAEIEQKTQQITETKAELKEMTEERSKEHQEWLVSDKDDKDAKVTVENAKGVLANFYSENGLMLAQLSKAGRQQPFVSQAGEAPPPPPSTWEAPYGGKKDEQTGIIAMLDMVVEDIQKDITKAKTEEDASLALYDQSKAAMLAEIGSLQGAIVELDGVKGTKEQAVQDNVADRLGKDGELGSVMTRIRDAEPGCDYFQINYPLRVKNRQIEVDGLNKAKIILSGGEFSTPEDPNREMRPGDAAFVQRHKFLGRAAVL